MPGLDTIVSHGLNLAGEYRHHRKSKSAQKEAQTSEDNKNHSTDSNPLIENDEEDWQLDELISRDSTTPPPSDDAAYATFAHLPPPSANQPRSSLPLPVVIPQRRPGTKKRGFVRAYAPVLQDCGIDQDTFLRFLKDFHRSSQASPWIGVVQVSAAIAGFAPSLIAMAVCMSVQVAAAAGAEVQQRYRTNDFLAKANEELFKPCGLWAMIVTFKPDTVDPSSSSRNDLISISTKLIGMGTEKLKTGAESSEGSVGNFTRKLKMSAATTRGEDELPEFAPLVFPDVDALVRDKEAQNTKEKTKDLSKFLQGYMDRRAQMKFANENPDSSLNVSESERQMRSTGWVSKASTFMQNNQIGPGRGSPFQQFLGGSEGQQRPGGRGLNSATGIGRGAGGGSSGLSVKRLLSEDVLYLIIVNLPSERELAIARQ